MKIKGIEIIWICCALFFSACQEIEFNGKNPVAFTGKVDSNGDQGVTFYGDIILSKESKPIDCGFVWGDKPMPTLNDYSIKMGGIPSSGLISAKIDYDLLPDSKLHVRTFFRTEKEVVYGLSQLFDSKGCPVPKVISITPKESSGNDTITISGKYLTSKPSDLLIQYKISSLGSESSGVATVLSASPETIKFRLSNNKIPFYTKIVLSVKLRNTEIVSQEYIQLTEGPQLTGFNPKFISKKDYIKLKIKNPLGTIYDISFYKKSYNNRYEIRYSTNTYNIIGDSIQIKAPNLDYGEYKIGISSRDLMQVFTYSSEEILSVMRPEILNILEKTPFTGDTITIIGKYFDPNYALTLNQSGYDMYNSVTLRTLYYNSTYLKAILPNNLIEKSYTICLMDGYEVFPTFPIYTRSCWSMKCALPTPQLLKFNLNLLYHDKILLGLPYYYSSPFLDTYQIWEYDIPSNNFTRLTASVGKTYEAPVTFIEDDKLFIGGGMNFTNEEFLYENYHFDLIKRQWSPGSPYNGPTIKYYGDHVSTCSFESKTYMKRRHNQGVYWHDKQNDNWIFLNDFPEIATDDEDRTILLTDDSKLYLAFLDYTMYAPFRLKLYELNKSSNAWVKKMDISYSDYFGQGIILDNNSLWIVGSPDLLQYSMDGILLRKHPNLGSRSDLNFFHNGKLYSMSSYWQQILEFDPNKH